MSDMADEILRDFEKNAKTLKDQKENNLDDVWKESGVDPKELHKREFQREIDDLYKQLDNKEDEKEGKKEDQKDPQELLEHKEEVIHAVVQNLPEPYAGPLPQAVIEGRKAAKLPASFTQLLGQVLADRASLTHFGGVKDAARRLSEAKGENEAAAAMADLLSNSVDYLGKRSAWRLSRITWRRRKFCKELMGQIALFMGSAPSVYLEKIGEATKDEDGNGTDAKFRDFMNKSGDALEAAGVSRSFEDVIEDRRFSERASEEGSPESEIKFGLDAIADIKRDFVRFENAPASVQEAINIGYVVHFNRCVTGCRDYLANNDNADRFLRRKVEKLSGVLEHTKAGGSFETLYPEKMRWTHVLGSQLAENMMMIYDMDILDKLSPESIEAIKAVDTSVWPILFDDLKDVGADRIQAYTMRIDDLKRRIAKREEEAKNIQQQPEVAQEAPEEVVYVREDNLIDDILDENGLIDPAHEPEEILDARNDAMRLIFKKTGMDDPDARPAGIDKKHLDRLPVGDIIELGKYCLDNHTDQKTMQEAIVGKIQEFDQKYTDEYLDGRITELYEIKKKNHLQSGEMRQLSLYALDRSGENPNLDALDTITLVAMAFEKLKAKKSRKELVKEFGEELVEGGDKTLLRNRQKEAELEIKKTQLKEDKKKQNIKEEAPKWKIEEKYLLQFMGDIYSGEDRYDKTGKVVPKKDRMTALMDEYVPCINSLVKGRISELENKHEGVQSRLLSGASAQDGEIFRVFKDVLDPLLDLIIKEAGNKKINAGFVRETLKKPEAVALINSMEARIDEGMKVHVKRVEDEIESITEDVYEEFSVGFGYLISPDNEIKKGGKDVAEEVFKLSRDRDRAFSMKTGHGKFIAALMRDYFKKASPRERRFMFSCLIKDIAPRNDKAPRSGNEQNKRAGLHYASLMKGAGPMMQKILQGIPERTVRPEFQTVLQIVKSDLRPIPENYEKAKLEEIRVANKLTSIKRIRPLGAASVAQTFLCEIQGPKIKGKKEVVVKIQRPDAEVRYEKEEKSLILGIAREADKSGISEAGVLAQMKNVDRELDFTNEAKNAKKGQVYNLAADKKSKDKPVVKVVNITKEIKTTKDVMAMDKAEGVTVDRYIQELKEVEKECMETFNVGKDPITHQTIYAVTPENSLKLDETRGKLVQALNTALNRHKHLMAMTQNWIQEALFGGGFQHGDMHAGNIMISDNGATVLDFGNCNEFGSKTKRNLILKMMMAAFFGRSDTFVSDFRKVLEMEKNPAFNMTAEQSEKLTKELEEVFKLGEGTNTGDRIFVALMKAQELGIKIPPAIQNFSACEQRFENTIREYNDRIKSMLNTIDKLDRMGTTPATGTDSLDLVCELHGNIGLQENEPKKPADYRVQLTDIILNRLHYFDEDKKSVELLEFTPEKEKEVIKSVSRTYDLSQRFKKNHGIDFNTDPRKWREVYKKALSCKYAGQPVPEEVKTELKNIKAKLLIAASAEEMDCVFGGTEGFITMVTAAFSDELNEEKFEELFYLFDTTMCMIDASRGVVVAEIENYKSTLADLKAAKKKPTKEDTENIASNMKGCFIFEYAFDQDSTRLHKLLSPDQYPGAGGEKLTPKEKAALYRRKIESTRPKIENDLAGFMEKNNRISQHYNVFRVRQEEHLKFLEDGKPTGEAYAKRFKAEMEFIEVYKDEMRSALLSRRHDLADKVKKNYEPDDFIEKMSDCMSITNLFFVFPFKIGLDDYLPKDPALKAKLMKEIDELEKEEKNKKKK